MKVANWASRRAATQPDRVALAAAGATLTYAELERDVVAVACRLAALGVGRGDPVVLTLPAGIEHAVVLHAAIRLGALACPVDARLGEAGIDAALDGASAPVIASAEDLRPPIGDRARIGDLAGAGTGSGAAGRIDLDAPWGRILTSGTSAAPRPVELTHGNHRASAIASALNLGVRTDDRWLCCLPLFHVSGLSIVLRCAIYGTTAVIHDRFDPERVAAALEGERITLVSLVPTQLARLLDRSADLAAPRAILLGGGPVADDVLDRALERGAVVVQTYGLTEAASQVTTLAPAEAATHRGSAGRPLPGTEVTIDEGEILVRGPTVARACIAEDGWLHTGDRGRLDEDGYLYVDGRIDDLIVSGGENVAPEPVEEVLRRHPDVADAAVVGRPDTEWGQAVTAIVVLRGGGAASPEDLRRHCSQFLAPFQVPKAVEISPQLPRTPSGKLIRRRLR